MHMMHRESGFSHAASSVSRVTSRHYLIAYVASQIDRGKRLARVENVTSNRYIFQIT